MHTLRGIRENGIRHDRETWSCGMNVVRDKVVVTPCSLS